MMRNESILSSPKLSKLKKQRQKIVKAKMVATILLICSTLLAFAYVARTPALNIEGVTVRGNKVIETERIQELALMEMTGTYLWIIPKTNIFLYPRNSIRTKLNDESKRLKEIIISINKRVLEISVTERDGIYTWCSEAGVDQAKTSTDPKKETCYFVDDGGYIFAEAPYFSGNVYFKFYGPTSSIGDKILNGNFDRIVELKSGLESIGLRPVALVFDQSADISVLLERQDNSRAHPMIILNLESDFAKSVDNLSTALESEPLATEFSEKYSELEYMDLRFGNKVYYKFSEI